MQSISFESFSYEQWIKKSIHLFEDPIPITTTNFDEKDHQIATEYNLNMYNHLITLRNAWIKRWAAFDIVRLIMPFINSKEPLHASSFLLAEKIKTCLTDLKKIDKNDKKPESEWFYDLITLYKVRELIEPLIKNLNERIENSNPAAASTMATHP